MYEFENVPMFIFKDDSCIRDKEIEIFLSFQSEMKSSSFKGFHKNDG